MPADLAKRLKKELPHEIDFFINEASGSKTVEALFTEVESSDLDAISTPLKKARLLAPITSPPKILCLGLNYAAHIIET